MKVLLLDTVEKLGKVGEVVVVSDGYARNFLLPRRLATLASEGQIRFHEERVKKAREKYDKEVEAIKKMVEKLENTELEIEKKSTKDGKLFASVGKNDVEKILKKTGIEYKEVKIDMSKLEKKLGKYPVVLDFGSDVKINLSIKVVEKKD